MYIVTTMSLDELSSLIRDKHVSLNNSHLLFGTDSGLVSKYFKDRIGSDGYVLGLRGRLNKTTAHLFANMDTKVNDGRKVILEAEVDEDDLIRLDVSGVSTAAEALEYGLEADDVIAQLDEAQVNAPGSSGVEVLCVPTIKANGKLRVTSLTDNLEFNVEGIAFVKIT